MDHCTKIRYELRFDMSADRLWLANGFKKQLKELLESMQIGDFIRYNLDVLMESISIFSDYLNRKIKEQDEALENIRTYGLSTRQEDVLAELIQSGEPFTVYELSSMFNTNEQNIRKDLILLKDLGLVNICGKEGHKIKYIYSGQR